VAMTSVRPWIDPTLFRYILQFFQGTLVSPPPLSDQDIAKHGMFL
jgi:hypothetical protein